MLGSAVLVKESSGHSNKGGVGIHVLEVGANPTGTKVTQDAMAFVGIAKAVDGAVGVVNVDAAATAARWWWRRRAGATTVLGPSAAVSVLRATLARRAVAIAGAFTVTPEKLWRGGSNGRSHGQDQETKSRLLHCNLKFGIREEIQNIE